MIDGTSALDYYQENYEKLPSLYIEKQYMNNSKIARKILGIDMENGTKEYELNIRIKENIVNLVDLKADPNITISARITAFDSAVMDAAYTIINSGVKVLTAEWVVKVLAGNMKLRPTREKIAAVRESLDKLRLIHIKIDATKELEKRRDTKNKIDSYIYESYLLPVERIETRYATNGKAVIAYPVLTVPALYRYAEQIHQIIDIPIECFDMKGRFSETEEAILIKRYIIRRIAQIKNSKNKLTSNKISYRWIDQQGNVRGMFEELGYKPNKTKSWKNTKKPMIHKIAKYTLESLVDNGMINGFEEYRADGTKNPASPIMGFVIQV